MDNHKDQDEIFEEMQKLSEDIAYHADLFFNKDRQVIPNHVYDEMVVRWNELAEARPDLAELFQIHKKAVPIHVPTDKGLTIVYFDEPMLSLKKAHSIQDVDKFLDDVGPAETISGEYKMDGLALQIDYVDWQLTRIATRGDGLVGEDVTHALPMYSNIPVRIPETYPRQYSARGEGVVGFDNFHRYNEAALKPRSTPRNAVSGWTRALQQNQDPAAKGLCVFFMYGASDTSKYSAYDELRKSWENMGFTIAPVASRKDIEENNELLDYPTDGIVLKVNLLDHQKKLGGNSRYPRWAVAYKYPHQIAETSFIKVEWVAGKTGSVTPTGIYQPIKIGGVMCSRALLHNYRHFMSLGLREDSEVFISRNGDVIPQVDSISNHGIGRPLQAPTECPSCGSVLQLRVTKTSADLHCDNTSGCPAQLLARCLAMVHKRCLDIDDLGPVLLSKLIDDGKIERTSDIFDLTPEDVGQKIWGHIQSARRVTLERFIVALGLPAIHLGRAKKLAAALPADVPLLVWLRQSSEIIKVPGFSAGLAMPIAVALEDEEFQKNIKGLANHLTVIVKPGGTQEFTMKGSITGEIGQQREALIEYFADQGIELLPKLTKDCEFLIVGENPGNAKLLKATEMGIRTVNGTQVDSIDTLIQHIKGASTSG